MADVITSQGLRQKPQVCSSASWWMVVSGGCSGGGGGGGEGRQLLSWYFLWLELVRACGGLCEGRTACSLSPGIIRARQNLIHRDNVKSLAQDNKTKACAGRPVTVFYILPNLPFYMALFYGFIASAPRLTLTWTCCVWLCALAGGRRRSRRKYSKDDGGHKRHFLSHRWLW